MSVTFFPEVIVRCPALPFQPDQISEHKIRSLLTDDFFLDAILTASPLVYEEATKLREGKITDPAQIERLIATLTKYFVRMQTRSTPFGLFSGCGVTQWNFSEALTKKRLMSSDLQLDAFFLSELTKQLEANPIIKFNLSYKLNTTYYLQNEEIFYYSYQHQACGDFYELGSLVISDEIKLIIQNCTLHSLTFKQLVNKLLVLGKNKREELNQYVESLIDEQLLQSSLLPDLSNDFFGQIRRKVKTILQNISDPYLNQLDESFTKVADLLGTVQRNCLNENIKKIQDEFDLLGFRYDRDKLFFINSFLEFESGGIHTNLQSQLSSAIKALRVIAAGNETEDKLLTSKNIFEEKFDKQRIPLVDLGDPERGILYEQLHTIHDFGATIVNELNRSPALNEPLKAKISELNYLNQKILDANVKQESSIRITDDDLIKIKGAQALTDLPDTFPVIFQVLNRPDATLYVEYAGGTSGTTIVTRFAYHDEALQALIKDITAYESASNPDAMLINMRHIPENRTGNIVNQFIGRENQIDYYAGSGGATNISIRDISVILTDQKFKLIHNVTNKEVIPKIDNAHNYQAYGLPVYKFWGQLQSEGKQTNLSINVNIPGIKYVPRIIYKKVILRCAEWRFKPSDWGAIFLKKDKSQQIEALELFLNNWLIPNYFLFYEGDQTLFFDRSNKFSLQLFLSVIKNKSELVICEFIGPSNTPIKDEVGDVYLQQLVATAKFGKKQENSILNTGKQTLNSQRDFLPGEEWVYFKLYTSKVSSDSLICTLLQQFCNQYIQQHLIEKWFFIRYKDPMDHIRFRIKLKHADHFSTIVRAFNQSIQPFLENKKIWKIQMENYSRELERYSVSNYNTLESIFFVDSEFCAKLLQWKKSLFTPVDLISFSAKFADDTYNMLSINLPEKLRLSRTVGANFYNEFKINSYEKQIFSKYHRESNTVLKNLIENDQPFEDAEVSVSYEQWRKSRRLLVTSILAQNAGVQNKENLATDLIHLFYNRLFYDKQRIYEMIGHTVLTKFYTTKIFSKPK